MRLEHETRIENRVGYPDSHNSLDANKSVGRVSNTSSDEEKLTVLYNELERIDSVLSNPNTTKEQALKELESYNFLIKNNENAKLLNSTGNEIAEKSRAISDKIQDYFIMKDMVTFGYFIEKMDTTSKYAYDISVKYQREGMNKYVDFYKDVTKKINTFGDHIGDSVDDGKKNLVSYSKFGVALYEAVEPYLYHGGGKGHTLYENNIKLIKVGDDKFNVLIDGKLVEKEVSYKEAYGKMEYFFSCHEPVIKGTKICKSFEIIKDDSGNICGLEGKVEQFLFPAELFQFMKFESNERALDGINENFDKSFKGEPPTFSKWDNVTVEAINATSDVSYTENALKQSYASGKVYYQYYKDNVNNANHYYQHTINSINQKIDGAKKGLQLTLDEYTQRYNTVNSNYDNMLRTITTMISELAQELKGFLRF
ncbi:hypothetical protein [Morganella psychrotolerans]|uniref:hypothetical protein n=1 Tax=Morganella psychrotolerans TaxID=368603 RepID=UPI0039B0AA18